MSKEKIQALEALLRRVQKNAAEPRPARVAAEQATALEAMQSGRAESPPAAVQASPPPLEVRPVEAQRPAPAPAPEPKRQPEPLASPAPKPVQPVPPKAQPAPAAPKPAAPAWKAPEPPLAKPIEPAPAPAPAPARVAAKPADAPQVRGFGAMKPAQAPRFGRTQLGLEDAAKVLQDTLKQQAQVEPPKPAQAEPSPEAIQPLPVHSIQGPAEILVDKQPPPPEPDRARFAEPERLPPQPEPPPSKPTAGVIHAPEPEPTPPARPVPLPPPAEVPMQPAVGFKPVLPESVPLPPVSTPERAPFSSPAPAAITPSKFAQPQPATVQKSKSSAWLILALLVLLVGAGVFVYRRLLQPIPPLIPPLQKPVLEEPRSRTTEPENAPSAQLPEPTEPSVTASASAAGPAPSVVASADQPELPSDPKDLPATLGFLTVVAKEPGSVFLNGQNSGDVNKPLKVTCGGTKNLRVKKVDSEAWFGEGQSIVVKCRESTVIRLP